MRKVIITGLVTLVAGAGVFLMWRPDLLERSPAKTEAPPAKDVYYCPMHPLQKSDKPGNCPICSMKLVKMEHENHASPAADAGEYYCPMHPQQRSDKPGNCPICSMKLVKMEKPPAGSDVNSAPPTGAAAADSAPSIFIAPERQQLIGVKTVAVERKALVKEIRTVGKVAFDETRITHVHTKVAGFIEEVFVDFVGKEVKRGQPLFTIYSPDLVATQEEYLLALKSNRSLKDSSFDWVSKGSINLLEAARKRLQLWDIGDAEIAELEKSGKAKRALTIHSAVSGVVTQRAAYHHGKYVTPDMELYTIVDLSTVWILGEVYESDLPFLRLSQPVTVEFPSQHGITRRTGRVDFISPMLDPKTRSAQVRVQFSNPTLTLRPDMFVHFVAQSHLGNPLVVPLDAVLDTGTEQYVFVDKGQGYFEPRKVGIGAEAGDSWEMLWGLRAGERVVTAANFILDSESRLKGALAGMGSPSSLGGGQPPAASAPLNVQILEPRTAKVGRNSLRLMLKDGAGSPIQDAEVDVTIVMPQMGSMASMRSSAKLKPMGGGQYVGELNVPLAWTWETTVTAKKEGRMLGSARASLIAR